MSDRAHVLLSSVVRLLPDDRSDWGRAMLAELDQIDGRRYRWRFVLGCTRATLFLPHRPGTSARTVVESVLAATVGCIGLVAYGFTRYPGLRTDSAAAAVLAFVVTMVGYAVVGVVVARRLDRRPAVARTGMLGGLAIAVLCLLVGAASTEGTAPYVGISLMLTIPVVGVAVGVAGARRGQTAGRDAAFLSAVVAGLVVFLVWAGDSVLAAGRPYGPGLTRDFASSGSPDLATYAVNDSLGTAMMLLLVIPLVTATVGCAAAAIATAHRRSTHGGQ
jgi:hypothetical protein